MTPESEPKKPQPRISPPTGKYIEIEDGIWINPDQIAVFYEYKNQICLSNQQYYSFTNETWATFIEKLAARAV